MQRRSKLREEHVKGRSEISSTNLIAAWRKAAFSMSREILFVTYGRAHGHPGFPILFGGGSVRPFESTGVGALQSSSRRWQAPINLLDRHKVPKTPNAPRKGSRHCYRRFARRSSQRAQNRFSNRARRYPAKPPRPTLRAAAGRSGRDTAGSRSNAIGGLVAMPRRNDAKSSSASGWLLRHDLAQLGKRERDKCGC
jgi:hypothetical protein